MTKRLNELAANIGAEVLAAPPADVVIDHVYAGDRVSDLLNQAHDRAMLVSNLAGAQLVRVAELMDVPAICLVGGARPGEDVLAAARRQNIGVLTSPVGMFETCGRLYQCLLSPSQKVL